MSRKELKAAAKQLMGQNYWPLLGAILVAGEILAAASYAGAVGAVFVAPVSMGLLCYIVSMAQGQRAAFSTLFSEGFRGEYYLRRVGGIAWMYLFSFLWSLLIRFLSEVLDKEYTSKAVVVMGTTVATGTFAVYGLSALFVSLSVYKTIFYVAAVLLPLIAIIWFFSYKGMLASSGSVTDEEEKEVNAPIGEKKKADFGFVTLILILAIFAVVTNLEKDGINVWVPTILKELYDMPDYLSILLTLCLPLVSIFGTAVAVFFNKYIKDFVLLCGLFFLATTGALALTLAFIGTSAAVMLVCLSLISLFMSGTNNVITSMAPLYYKEKASAGLLAGVLNGCCYIGSTLSSYGLGAVADGYGWNAVFYLLIACSAACVIISAIKTVIRKPKI